MHMMQVFHQAFVSLQQILPSPKMPLYRRISKECSLRDSTRQTSGPPLLIIGTRLLKLRRIIVLYLERKILF